MALGRDPSIEFAKSLLDRFVQFKSLQFQQDLLKRKEQRYDTQLQENRLHRQRQLSLMESDPRRAVAEVELETLRGATPKERLSTFTRGTTLKISAGEREKTAASLATMDVLINLRKLYDSPDTRTGPAVGRIDPVIGQVGMTSRNQEDFMAATSAFKNQIIKEITGAQMSEAEADRIMKQVPDITDHPTRWEAKWRQSVQNIQYLQRRRQEIQGGGQPKPWSSPSELPFGPTDGSRPAFPQNEIDFTGVDLSDLEGLFD